MGDTADICLCEPNVQTQFLAEYLNKTQFLICMLQHVNSKKVLRSKIPIQDTL